MGGFLLVKLRLIALHRHRPHPSIIHPPSIHVPRPPCCVRVCPRRQGPKEAVTDYLLRQSPSEAIPVPTVVSIYSLSFTNLIISVPVFSLLFSPTDTRTENSHKNCLRRLFPPLTDPCPPQVCLRVCAYSTYSTACYYQPFSPLVPQFAPLPYVHIPCPRVYTVCAAACALLLVWAAHAITCHASPDARQPSIAFGPPRTITCTTAAASTSRSPAAHQRNHVASLDSLHRPRCSIERR